MTPSMTLRLGGLLGALAVGLGAFAAHGLEGRISPGMIEVFQTGARYQMDHALAILLCGALAGQRRTGPAATFFLLGIVLFSGSLYALALSDLRWIGVITPFGGIAFLLGWVLLAFSRKNG